jgi:flavin reductase (DIM6/NTAB) family NADH-FMN oxidoreductase RutF
MPATAAIISRDRHEYGAATAAGAASGHDAKQVVTQIVGRDERMVDSLSLASGYFCTVDELLRGRPVPVRLSSACARVFNPGARQGRCVAGAFHSRHARSVPCDTSSMRSLSLSKAFTLLEPGPVVLVTTNDGDCHNVMTISWTMVLDFKPCFAITTGAWNFSFSALRKTRECVLAIPGVDLLDTVVAIGTCSGADTDKFTRFGLTPLPGRKVRAPLIGQCLANVECVVTDFIRKHDIVVLEAVAAWTNRGRREQRTIHAIGDGTFVADGRRFDRRKAMASKLAPAVRGS